MTVCIGAIAHSDVQIVLAADFMISEEVMSTETNVSKIEPLSKSQRWWGGFAGVPSVWDVALRHARTALEKKRREGIVEVREAIGAAFRDGLREKIEGEILSPFGLDRKTFVRQGRAFFGNREFAQLVGDIKRENLETEALVVGFEPKGAPRLIHVSDRGVCRQEEHAGFHAIGMGDVIALGSLCTHYDQIKDVTELIYRVSEAKFLAESALGVGKRTVVMVLRHDGTHRWLDPDQVEHLRIIWNTEGRPPIPDTAVEFIRGGLKPMAIESRIRRLTRRSSR
jgi:20S proteasome alpha/beta subunit